MKIKVKNLKVVYDEAVIIEDLNLGVDEGDFVSILGPSGIGKSTLLNIIAGSLEAEEGEVEVNGRIAYMPQDDLLFPWRNIIDNLTLYGEISGGKKGKAEARQQAMKEVEAFGLKGYEYKYPNELSGGMRQRAAFLRTALCQADILLLDEPFASLDAETRLEMQDWLSAMRGQLNCTTILVTHDRDEAVKLSDHIYKLDGKPARLSDQ